MKNRLVALIAAALLLFSLLALSGCTTIMDEYDSDTFELGDAAAVVLQK